MRRNKQNRQTKTEEKRQKEQKDTETPRENEHQYVLQLIKHKRPLAKIKE